MANRVIEVHQGQAGPRHITDGRAAEAERPQERGLAVRAYQPGEERAATVEDHRAGRVRLAYPAVGERLVVGLDPPDRVADEPGPGHVGGTGPGQVRDHGKRVVV